MPDSSPNPQLMAALALHYDDLVDYVRRKFSGRDFARDLVHDICVQMLEKPVQERIAVPLAFLRRTAFNRGVDRVRADRTRHAYLQLPVAQDAAVDHWDGARALDFEQQLVALLSIIEALPARQRQVFLLHRIHAMSQRDIADELGISANMVNQHFSRAMRAIAQQWEPARQVCRAR